jgi:hypothetical protein
MKGGAMARRRRLTKLEAEAAEVLLDETQQYLTGQREWKLEPGYYEGTFVARRPALRGPLGSMLVMEARAELSGRWFSIYFERPPNRPTRDWRLGVYLNGEKDVSEIRKMSIAKERHGYGHGQYLNADRIRDEWRITHSEYD